MGHSSSFDAFCGSDGWTQRGRVGGIINFPIHSMPLFEDRFTGAVNTEKLIIGVSSIYVEIRGIVSFWCIATHFIGVFRNSSRALIFIPFKCPADRVASRGGECQDVPASEGVVSSSFSSGKEIFSIHFSGNLESRCQVRLSSQALRQILLSP